MDGGTKSDEIDEMGGRKEVEHEANEVSERKMMWC